MSSKPTLLDADEASNIILEIVIGEKIIYFPNSNLDYPDTILLRHPTGPEKLWANFVEQESLKSAIDMGLVRNEDLPEELIEQFFSNEDQESLDTLTSKIKAYSTMVSKGIKGSVIYDQNIKKLAKLKDAVDLLKGKRNLAKQLSADFKALEDKYYALMVKCVLNINREPIWSSLKELEQETNVGYLERLLYEYFLPFFMGYGTDVLRFIARSGEWGNRFYASLHTGQKLFSTKSEDLSIDQLALLSWSIFYYDMSQMSDEYRPDDDTYNDDVKLDAYIEQLSRKLKAESRSKKQSDKKGGNKSADHQNVIVTAGSNEYVSLHKQGIYSDPREIKGRVKDSSNSTSYNEAAAAKEAKRKRKATFSKNK